MSVKVLLIDDEDRAESTIRRLKIIHKLDVHWAQNPEDGLKMIKNGNYSIVVFDIMMPVENEKEWRTNEIVNNNGLLTGIILYKKIKKIKPAITGICCSARRKEIIDGHLEEGKDYAKFFRKPFNTKTLFNEIAKYLKP